MDKELPADDLQVDPRLEFVLTSLYQLEVLPLYSALAPAAQAHIFLPTATNVRRIIVSTNIAETSITIPGVAYVIDTGYKKEKEYMYRTSGGNHLARLLEFSQCLYICRHRASCEKVDQ